MLNDRSDVLDRLDEESDSAANIAGDAIVSLGTLAGRKRARMDAEKELMANMEKIMPEK